MMRLAQIQPQTPNFSVAWMASVVVHIPLGSMPAMCLSDGTPSKTEERNIL